MTLLHLLVGFCIVKLHTAGLLYASKTWITKGVIVKGSRASVYSYLVSFCVLFLFGVGGGSCGSIPRRLAVCEVQGTGLESPYLDQEVITSGIVVADLESVEPGGFLILDETCSLSGDSSRGLYVSLVEGDDLVDVGDQVRVQGIIREIGGETRLEGSRSDLEVLSLDNPLPDPINLMGYLIPPLTFGYEKWEDQLVAISRASLVESAGDTAQIRVCPQLPLDPSTQLVCFREESFSLEIKEDLLSTGLGDLQSVINMEGLVGYIRQDQDGYYLQLIDKPDLKLREQDPGAEGIIPVSSTSYLKKTPQPSITPTSSQTVTPKPSPRPTQTFSPTIVPSPTYYPVRLLISEILPNPSGEEPGGEWIEIYYLGGGRLPLDGIKIGDETSPAGKEGLLRFPDGYFIQDGQVLVIANQAWVFESQYGYPPDFELVDSDSRVPDLIPYDRWGRSTVKLSNTGDEVLLVDPWDQVVDMVVYGTSGTSGFSPPVPAPKEGHSLERYPPGWDSDQAADWREKSSPSPGNLDLSTPTGTPTPTWVASPSQTSTVADVTPTVSPTLEVLTPYATSTDLPEPTTPLTETATPTDDPTNSLTPMETPEITCSPSPSPSPSQTIMAVPTSTSTAGTPDFIPSATPSLTPCSTGTPTPLDTPTETVTLTPTPGLLIIFNEILADPDPTGGDSNGDGEISSDDDEFLELVNISGMELDLSGWQVFDEVRLRYTFPEGTSVPCGSALVIFGGGNPTGTFGGSLVFTASSLGLNNTGDLLTLVDADGKEVAVVGYGSEGNQNQSLNRNPDLLGPLPLVPHSEIPGSEGRLYSPGTKVDLSGYGDCP